MVTELAAAGGTGQDDASEENKTNERPPEARVSQMTNSGGVKLGFT